MPLGMLLVFFSWSKLLTEWPMFAGKEACFQGDCDKFGARISSATIPKSHYRVTDFCHAARDSNYARKGKGSGL